MILWFFLLPVFLRAETTPPSPATPAAGVITPETPPAAEVETPASLRRKSRELWARRKTSPEPWILLGRAYDAEGRKGKALSAFAKALKVDPLSAEAYYRRGKIFEEKKKLDEAANEYQAALKVNSSYTEAAAAWKKLSDRLNVSGAK